jgi:tetratricopeptide (TPR) repeat protein
VKFLKRFNREQLTLGVAAILGVLLFGWQVTRSSGDTAAGELPNNDRFYGIGRQTTIEFVDPKVERYMVGRDIWEPPTAGRLPVPEIRPPEPRLGQITLPPLAPRPDDAEFNKVNQPGKNRTLAAVVNPTPAPGFPAEAEIAALKDLAEVDVAGRIVDRRKQLMRQNGLTIVHLLPPKSDVEGRLFLDNHETSDKAIVLEVAVGGGLQRMTFRPDEIDLSAAAPAFEGVERGGEYGKEYKRRAARLGPDDIEGHLKLGDWCRRSAGMIPEACLEIKIAIEALSKKQDYGPRMRSAVLQLVENLRDLGEYEEAIDSIQDYIESVKGGEGADMHIHLGRLYAELGYHERSLLCYDNANSLEPGAAKPRVAVARARLNLGEFRLAIEQIDALLLAGGPPDAEALKVQGLARLRQGDAGGAEDSFTASLKVKPGDAETLNGLGVAQALQNKAEAAHQFLAAIKANQYLTDAWINLASLYLSVGRANEADILFAGAAQRDPDSAVAAAGPAFIALLKGSFNEAGPGFERARKIQPDDYYMAYALGRLKLRQVKPQEALELFRAALKSNPEYIPATTDAALAYLMLARDEQKMAASAPADKQAQFRERADAYRVNAQTLLEASYRADPTSPAANAALGCVYAVVRGKVREAREAFNRAVRQNIPDPLIDYGRAYLEYWYGADSPKARLDLAEVGFTFGASHQDLKDPSDKEWAAECARALQSINDWRVQRIMIDERFDGNKSSPSNAWIQVQLGTDPNIRYMTDRAFLGDASGTSQAGAFVALEHRQISRDNFLSVEGSFVYEASGGFEAGFSLYLSELKGGQAAAGGLHFVIDEDATAPSPKPLRIYFGQMTSIPQKGPSRPHTLLGTLPAAPSTLRFKLSRKEHETKQKTWNFTFSVWDESKGAWRDLTGGGGKGDTRPMIEIGQQMSDAKEMMMQFWARTRTPGRKWSVGVDDVRVLVVEKQ